jgi:5-methylcytosine-specific restriction endonuclease McrA
MNQIFKAVMPKIAPSGTASDIVKNTNKKYKKKAIPKALREQVWIQKVGHVFETKCCVQWCENHINAFNFQAGHNIPESKGGATTVENLIPICDRCNCSMGDRYTIDEWNHLGAKGAFVLPAKPATPTEIHPNKLKKPWWCGCFI